jgi:putative peptidoglycan lipid II flippase
MTRILPAASANRQIARSAAIVMVAMVLSQLVGLLAKSMTGAAFGTGMESEAFFAANRFSEILFNLVAGGALGSAFIPTFTGLLAQENRANAWKLASAVANLILLILTLLSILAAIFAPQVVRYILAPGFSAASPEKEALTIQLLRIQLPSAAIFGLSGLVMGILNAHQSFLLPSLAPAMYSCGWIFGAIVLAPFMGIHGLAWGIVLGALLHLGLQVPALLRLPKKHYTPTLGFKFPAVREVARLMGPRLLGVAVVQLNFLLNTFLASFQMEGSLSGISLAFPLMIMPQAAIAQSIAIAALPTFSAQAACGRLDEMRSSLAATLRGVLLLAVPATIGLILLRVPLVTVIYQRHEFTASSVELVAWALLWYAVGLVGHSLMEIVSRAFYALHDTKTPVMVGIAAMTLNLVFSLLFSTLFTRLGWMPHGGLALANSTATALETAGLIVLMRRRLGGIQGSSIWRAALKASFAAVLMGAAVIFWLWWGAELRALVLLAGGVAIGGLVYGVVLFALGVQEIRLVMQVLLKVLPHKGA